MKQVMVVRTDLKMGKGKIAAQCCHASIGSYRKANPKKISKWEQEAYTKIVLKVDSLEELMQIKNKAIKNNVNYYIVVDAGRTQIPSSSVTVLGLGPDEDNVLDNLTGDLKLL